MVVHRAGLFAAVTGALGLALLLALRSVSDPGGLAPTSLDHEATDIRPPADATLIGRASIPTRPGAPSGSSREVLGGLVLLDGSPSPATIRVWACVDGPNRPHVDRRLAGMRSWGGPHTADADGRFAIGVEVPGRYRLLATRGTARGTASVHPMRPHETAPVTVTLTDGRERLTGVAVRDDGRPLRGVVFLRQIPGDDAIPVDGLRRTTPDAQGRFALSRLPAGRVTVGTELDGGALFWGPVVRIPYAEPYRLVVAPHARSVEIRVLDEATGEPLSGAEVAAVATREVDRGRWTGRDPVGGRRARADAGGRVRLAVPEAPLLVVTATHEGHLEGSVDLEVSEARTTLRLRRAGRLVGTVRHHETREPVAGVSVRCDRHTDVSDAAGRFVLDGLQTHDLSVSAWGPDVVPHGDLHQDVEIRSGETTSVELLVEPAIVVRGRVVTSGGEPVPGAAVWLHRTIWSGVPGEVLARFRALCDGAGRFAIQGVPGNEHVSDFAVLAKGPGHGVARTPLQGASPSHVFLEPSSWSPLEAPDHKESRPTRVATDPLEIVLPDPRHARVRAEDVVSAAPVPGVRIRVDAFTESVTDETGWARLGPLAPGSKTLDVRAPGWRMKDGPHAKQTFTVPERGEAETVVRLQRTCRIAGRFVYANGTPADDRGFGIGVCSPSHSFWTDVHRGRFRFDDLPHDTYEVTIVRGGMEVAAVVGDDDERIVGRATIAPDQADVRIVLAMDRPTPLEVLVLDGHGEPLSEAKLHFTTSTVDEEFHSGVWIVEPRRVGEGRLVMSGLESPVWLTVEPLPGPAVSWARKRVGPIPPGTPRVEVRLEPGHAVEGRVVDDTGEPVGRVPVKLWPDDTPQVFVERGRPLAETVSGADGRFAFDRIPRGRHWLSCHVPKAFGAFEPLEVEAGEMDAVLRLHRRRAFQITVLGAHGQPLANASIACREPPWYSDDGRTLRTGADGVATAADLDERRRYTVVVKPPSDVKGQQGLVVHDWQPTDATLRLDATHVVRGRVVDEHGAPAVGARVLGRTDAGATYTVTAQDASARFEVHLPSTARVHLEADHAGKRSAAVAATPGGAEADLVVSRRGGVLRVVLEDWPVAVSPTHPRQQHRSMAWVWREDRLSWTDRASVSSDGRIDVEGLDPTGRYALFVRHPDDPQRVVRLTGLRADGKTVTASPSPTRTWSGRVRKQQGVHFSRLTVMRADVEIRELDEDGGFEIRGLPRGPWQVHASAWWRGTPLSTQVEARDGRIPDIVFPIP